MHLGAQCSASTLDMIRKDFPDLHVFLWTDSEIALFWLSSTHKLTQFVQNKVDSINKLFYSSFWCHTPHRKIPQVSFLVAALHSHYRILLYGLMVHLAFMTHRCCHSRLNRNLCSLQILIAVVAEQVSLTPSRISNIVDLGCFNHYSRLLATSVYVHRLCYHTGNRGPPSTAVLESIE